MSTDFVYKNIAIYYCVLFAGNIYPTNVWTVISFNN